MEKIHFWRPIHGRGLWLVKAGVKGLSSGLQAVLVRAGLRKVPEVAAEPWRGRPPSCGRHRLQPWCATEIWMEDGLRWWLP